MAERAPARVPSDGALDSTEIQAISDWLIGRGLVASDFADTLTGFCERLREAGVPLVRGMITMRTLHPTVDGIGYIWREDRGTEGTTFEVGIADSEVWQRSPVNHMIVGDVRTIRRRLAGSGARLDFPILEELREAGATDYFARMVPFDIEPGQRLDAGMISSWVTEEAAGFHDHHIAILERLIPRLALSVNANLTKQIAVNVLDTYVGPDAGRRIMSGEIHQGGVEIIRAVALYADLRGFTPLTDTLPGAELIELLDAYYDRMVPAVVAHGGQVLKFLGDGMLATFDLEGQPRDAVCKQALTAAGQALAEVRTLNQGRARDAKPVMELDIVLHLGELFYGNIGAADRLDFTVIGPAVNEASRIEALCDPLNRNILVSETFAKAATACTDHLVPLGRHKLRGVRELQEIYGVDFPAGAR